MNLDNLSPKKFVEIMTKSNRLIECNCGYKKLQKKPFESENKNNKGYYIKCPKCNEKIYEQFIFFNNEKISVMDILPNINVIKTR